MKAGLGGHGIKYDSTDFYEQMLRDREHVRKIEGVEYPSIYEDAEAANAVLQLSSVTNGELAHRAYKFAEKKTGVALTDLSEGSRNVRMNYKDLLTRPHRYHNSPIWSGLMANGRAYSGYTYNVERLVPWRTLTGRQHFYLDHEGYIKFGEHMPTYKPSPRPEAFGELRMTIATGKAKMLNVLTPHGKWHIHSTFGDTQIMLTLSRGMEPCWLSEEDAEELGIKDNDWVEVFNDNGVYSARACVSARIPKGVCFVYHAVERTYSTPKSQVRGGRRSGMNNSLTRVHLKPNLMMGGYGQFTYAVNYWGPVGTNRDTFVLVQKMDKVEF
jgi:nitrate reductase alpha subunit